MRAVIAIGVPVILNLILFHQTKEFNSIIEIVKRLIKVTMAKGVHLRGKRHE